MASSTLLAIAVIIISLVGFAQIGIIFYYPSNNAKMGSLTISGLSGVEALEFGFIALLVFGVILAGIIFIGKRFKKNWFSKT